MPNSAAGQINPMHQNHPGIHVPVAAPTPNAHVSTQYVHSHGSCMSTGLNPPASMHIGYGPLPDTHVPMTSTVPTLPPDNGPHHGTTPMPASSSVSSRVHSISMSPTIGSVATVPPANAPLHVDFRIDPHARAGLTSTVPGMHGPGPLAPSCTATPLPSSGVGAHAQIADTSSTHPAVPTTSMVTFVPMVTSSTPSYTATPHVKLPKLVRD